LLLRTYLSLLVAQLDGKLVGDLVRSASLQTTDGSLTRAIDRSRRTAKASYAASATGSSSRSHQSTPTP
jgi:hypothetical protein